MRFMDYTLDKLLILDLKKNYKEVITANEIILLENEKFLL